MTEPEPRLGRGFVIAGQSPVHLIPAFVRASWKYSRFGVKVDDLLWLVMARARLDPEIGHLIDPMFTMSYVYELRGHPEPRPWLRIISAGD